MTPVLASAPDVPRARLSTSRLLWLVYALFMAYGSLTPFRFGVGFDDVRAKLARVSIDPLVSPDTGRRVSIPDVVQNLLFFMPFGLLGGNALGARRPGARVAATVIALGALFSVGIETAQLATVDRVSSFSDVISDALGTAAGIWIARLGRPRRLWATARPSDPDVRRALFGLAAATLLVGLALFAPYDPTLDVGTVAAKVHALQRDFWQVHSFLRQDRDEDVIRFMLFGGALTTWLRAGRVPLSAVVAIGVSIAMAIGLAGAELIVTTRLPGGLGVAAQAAGAVAGALAVATWPRQALAREGWWLPVIGLAIVGALFVSAALGASVEPARASHASADFSIMPAIRALILSALTFAPIGFGIALRRTTPRATVVAVAVSLTMATIAAAIEWHATGRADVGLVTVAPIGAWLGTATARYGGARFDAALDAAEPA